MLPDLRVALRLLWKDKAFSLTVALTLAVCIGANTALFSIVHNVLLRPLPYPAADRIVLMANQYPGAGVSADAASNSSVPDYFDRLRDLTVFDEQALYDIGHVTIDESGIPTRIQIQIVTPSFFRVIQVSPLIGRTFVDAEGEAGNDRKVVLSYQLWQSQFGGDPQAVGRDLRLNGQPYTVIGVMPRSLSSVNDKIILWRPAVFTADEKSDESRHSNNYVNIARLKPRATVAQAQSQVDALNRANLDRFPQYKQLLINARFRTGVALMQDELVRHVKPTLYLMWGGALFVLLIGCVNVANLVLVRSRVRLKELATRLALGAGKWRIARQLMTENLLLTLGSAVAGLFVGYAVLQLLQNLNIQDLPRGSGIRIDATVVASTLAAAAIIGVALGLIPVAYAVPSNLTTVLREEGRSGTAARGARILRRLLVVTQVAFAFILLAGAGLLFASFRRVLAVDPGFRAEGVMTASISLPRTRYKDETARVGFIDEALRRLRALPGVRNAGVTNNIPFGGNHSDSVILAEGYQMSPGESVVSPTQVIISPGYFEAMGVQLANGRFFDDRDGPKAPRVVIVDERLARHFWPNQNPVGRRMYRPTDMNHITEVTEKTVFITVVGVVRDVKLTDLAEPSDAIGTYYFPVREDYWDPTFALNTSGDPKALAGPIRETLKSLDRELPVFDMRTMEDRVERSLMTRRSPVLLSLSFGAVALFLSAIGIYGVLAYLVSQRTKEIGIRIALGSSAASIFELILREGLLLIGAGFALGAAGAFVLRRTLASELYGITAGDPFVLVTVTLLLAGVAMAACAIPASRATRIDPIVALNA